MILRRIQPKQQLAPFIDSLWIFEADFGIPTEDNRVIAPNGKAKIIYPYINGLATTLNGEAISYSDHDIYFIGLWDKPVTLSSTSRFTGTIGIELTPGGAYRFTKVSLRELVNTIFSFRDIFGRQACRLIERLENTPEPAVKILLLQDFLIEALNQTSRNNLLIDHTINLITSSQGLLEVREIEKRTGYSKRYIDLLFQDHLGLSPKTFGSIIRFQTFYKAWANSRETDFYKENLLDLYYDQPHFIKEFKRFTGYSPKQYAVNRNEFGRLFYKDR